MLNNDIYKLGFLSIAFWNKSFSKTWLNEPLGITIDYKSKRLLTLLKR